MFGVQQFDAILPPGTGSILAIAASTPKVVQLKNGHFGVKKSMTVTITCDHRHIYGADAAGKPNQNLLSFYHKLSQRK